VDEGRKRVLAIVAGILVARHLKTTDDLFDCRSSPRTESLVAAAVQWAERIMRKIDNVVLGLRSACSRFLAVETSWKLSDRWNARRHNSHAKVLPPNFIPAYSPVPKAEARTKFIQSAFLSLIFVGQDDQSEQVVAVFSLC
jgi:hypothetical protein